MAQMDFTLHAPVGAAFYVHVDGSIRLRFDSSQADKLLPWAREWLMLLEHYLKRRPGGSLAITDMPRNLEEINALVAKLNAQLAAERAGTEPEKAEPVNQPEVSPPVTPSVIVTKAQCPACLGVLNMPDEPICTTCNGTGAINAG